MQTLSVLPEHLIYINVQYVIGESQQISIDHERMVSGIVAWGVRWTGLFHSAKTNRDCLIEDNLGRYCLKTYETAKGIKERWCYRESNPGPLA